MQLTKYTRTLKFHVGLIIGLHVALISYFIPIIGSFILYTFLMFAMLGVLFVWAWEMDKWSRMQTPEEMWEIYLCQQQALLDANKV